MYNLLLQDRQILISKLSEVKEKRLGNLCKDVPLYHNNGPTHTSAIAKIAIAKTDFEVFELPPYSPDLAPSEYRSFPKLKVFHVAL